MVTAATELQTKLLEMRGGWKPQDHSRTLCIPDEKMIVASDWHIPYHDLEMVTYLILMAQLKGIKTLVIPGDLLDLPTVSPWGQSDYTTTQINELTTLREMMKLLFTHFDHIYWSRGNHEQRWMRVMKNQIFLEQLALAAGLGEFIDDGRLIVVDHTLLKAFESTWTFAHPTQHSRNVLDVPRQLAQKYSTHIMSGHTHFYGSSVYNGKHIVELGCMTDPKYHAYVQHNTAGFPEWVRGFWILDDGVPTGFLKEQALSILKKKAMVI
jgi:predicted phosphodiesterase